MVETTEPIGVYLHIPYCVKKCPYCDFNSYALAKQAGTGRGAVETMPEADYVQALCSELAHYQQLPGWSGREVASIFLGGGTPSLFSPQAIATLLNAISRSFVLQSNAEISIEANPGTIDEALGLEKLRGFAAAGINRISFGAQSFSAVKLQRLGRIHQPDDVPRAVNYARGAGIAQVNIDLMFGVDGEALAEWEEDLATAVSLKTDHLSVYGLTIEPGTEFDRWTRRGNTLTANEDLQADMYLMTQQRLSAAGFEQYEISNYARSGALCRHNLGYWQGRDYLGLGAGAHSFLRRSPADDKAQPWGQRWSNVPGPELYIARSRAQGDSAQRRDIVGREQARTEFFFLGLRLKEGISKARFEQLFEEPFDIRYKTALNELRREGLIAETEQRVALTTKGFLFADTVMASFE